MACVIYREGTGTVEHGIVCESTTCEIEHLEGLLSHGWSVNPPSYQEVKDEPEDDESDDASDINPVRLKAKDAGIEGWDTKRIGTLEKMLGE